MYTVKDPCNSFCQMFLDLHDVYSDFTLLITDPAAGSAGISRPITAESEFPQGIAITITAELDPRLQTNCT